MLSALIKTFLHHFSVQFWGNSRFHTPTHSDLECSTMYNHLHSYQTGCQRGQSSFWLQHWSNSCWNATTYNQKTLLFIQPCTCRHYNRYSKWTTSTGLNRYWLIFTASFRTCSHLRNRFRTHNHTKRRINFCKPLVSKLIKPGIWAQC